MQLPASSQRKVTLYSKLHSLPFLMLVPSLRFVCLKTLSSKDVLKKKPVTVSFKYLYYFACAERSTISLITLFWLLTFFRNRLFIRSSNYNQ